MRARVLLAAVPLLLTACDDDSNSGDTIFPGSTTTDAKTLVFDEAALEGRDGVQKILIDDYMIADVESVDCPADQEVKQGKKFDCVVTIGGDEPKDLKVTITVTSDEGEYQVALPEEQ